MSNDNSMSARILRNIEGIIENDPNLKEFCIVPTGDENVKNKSPVLYEENNLGLESWCVKYIYKHAHHDLLEARKLLSIRKLPAYKMDNLNHLLIGALLINPDVYTFWNMKRHLVEEDVLQIDKELHFSKLVLSYKSKSNEAFAYRRWLINRWVNKVGSSDVLLRARVLEKELEVTEMAANKAQNNYHAWNHRMWALGVIANDLESCNTFLPTELDFSRKWLFTHVSEHAGYHYRLILLRCVQNRSDSLLPYDRYYRDVKNHLKSAENANYVVVLREFLGPWDTSGECRGRSAAFVNSCSLVLHELFFTLEALHGTFPDHESVWCYRRSLVSFVLEVMYEAAGVERKPVSATNEMFSGCDFGGFGFLEALRFQDNGEKKPKVVKYELNKVESSLLYSLVLKYERMFVRKSVESSCSKLTVEYARRYECWLKYVLEFYVA